MRYTREILEPLVKESRTFSEVIKKLGKRPDGGTHTHIKGCVEKFGIDTSHFLGRRQGLNRPSPRKLSVDEYLKSSCVRSHILKLKLLENGAKHQCQICNNTDWMGQKIPLELDHIDGNNTNNDLKNLRLICPNCHAQTPTHAGKNKALKRMAP